MFWKEVVVLCNVTVVVVCNSYIEQNVQKHREVKQRKVKSVTLVANQVLNSTVNSKNPKWLYQQIEEKQQYQIRNKFAFQNPVFNMFLA